MPEEKKKRYSVRVDDNITYYDTAFEAIAAAEELRRSGGKRKDGGDMSLDVYLTALRRIIVCQLNITNNLVRMADEAGIGGHLWEPDKIGIHKASQLIGPLERGLSRMKADPERYKRFNPPNGWGSYERLLEFVEAYLQACRANPDADVKACN